MRLETGDECEQKQRAFSVAALPVERGTRRSVNAIPGAAN